MRTLHPVHWSLLAIIAALAGLIFAGRDSVITWSLAGIVGAYLGVDVSGIFPRGPPRA